RNQLIMVIFTFLDKGVPFDPQRDFCKCRTYNKDEQTGKKAYRRNFRDPELAMVPNGGGHDQKIDIHVVPYQYHNARSYHKPRYPFIITVHKYQYWKYKVKYQHPKK